MSMNTGLEIPAATAGRRLVAPLLSTAAQMVASLNWLPGNREKVQGHPVRDAHTGNWRARLRIAQVERLNDQMLNDIGLYRSALSPGLRFPTDYFRPR